MNAVPSQTASVIRAHVSDRERCLSRRRHAMLLAGMGAGRCPSSMATYSILTEDRAVAVSIGYGNVAVGGAVPRQTWALGGRQLLTFHNG